MSTPLIQQKSSTDTQSPAEQPVSVVNEMLLGAKQWVIVTLLVLVIVLFAPIIWKHLEKFSPGPDYRIPYDLSSDYWLYQSRANLLNSDCIPIIGDSVVWGEYVLPNGTLSHFLSEVSGKPGNFANCGVNGVFPLALNGLIQEFGGAFSNRKLIVQYNMLWQTSPAVDLSEPEEATFNHKTLIPQFFGTVPAYRADAETRMGAWAQTHISFNSWINHIDTVYFNSKSLPTWTLDQDDNSPPTRPNAHSNPFAMFDFRVPGEPTLDPKRGPNSKRHVAWSASGSTPLHFDWVPLNKSMQWKGFQNLIQLLKTRDNNVLVVIGPFNEHMIAKEQIAQYRLMREEAANWLRAQNVTVIMPDVLPSALYADTSHPLTEGYKALADEIHKLSTFHNWLKYPN